MVSFKAHMRGAPGLTRRLHGPQSRSELYTAEKNFLVAPGSDPRTIQAKLYRLSYRKKKNRNGYTIRKTINAVYVQLASVLRAAHLEVPPTDVLFSDETGNIS
jgi:hypothetical protein